MWRKKRGGGQTRYMRQRQLRKNLSRNDNSRKMMKIRKCIRSQRKIARKLWHNYAELYKKLDTAEGNKIIYKLAKTRNRRTKDTCDNIFINDKEGKIQIDTTKIIGVWKEHYVELLNVANPIKDLEECEKTCSPIPNITLEEVGTQLKKMKTGKACGPDQIPLEVWKLLCDEGVDYFLQTMNAVLVEGMSQSCRRVKYLHSTRGKVLCWNVGIVEESG